MNKKEIVVSLLQSHISKRHTQLLRFAFRLTRNLCSAEEITQEAYRKALTNWHSYDCRYAFFTWCCAIIKNLCIDRHRRKATHVVSLDQPVRTSGDGLKRRLDLHPGPEIPTLDIMMVREENEAARKAYTSLGQGQKAVVRLLAEDCLTYSQVARRLNIPVGTVRSRLHRARRAALCEYQ